MSRVSKSSNPLWRFRHHGLSVYWITIRSPEQAPLTHQIPVLLKIKKDWLTQFFVRFSPHDVSPGLNVREHNQMDFKQQAHAIIIQFRSFKLGTEWGLCVSGVPTQFVWTTSARFPDEE